MQRKSGGYQIVVKVLVVKNNCRWHLVFEKEGGEVIAMTRILKTVLHLVSIYKIQRQEQNLMPTCSRSACNRQPQLYGKVKVFTMINCVLLRHIKLIFKPKLLHLLHLPFDLKSLVLAIDHYSRLSRP